MPIPLQSLPNRPFDFYSTLLFVMTPKDAMTLVENNPSLEMVYQDLDGTLHISSGLKDLFVQGQ